MRTNDGYCIVQNIVSTYTKWSINMYLNEKLNLILTNINDIILKYYHTEKLIINNNIRQL